MSAYIIEHDLYAFMEGDSSYCGLNLRDLWRVPGDEFLVIFYFNDGNIWARTGLQVRSFRKEEDLSYLRWAPFVRNYAIFRRIL